MASTNLALGGGVDLAYVLLSPERISTFSVGIGAGEKLEARIGHCGCRN